MAENTLPLFADAGKFYVYVYRDPRPRKKNAPIYVGKGTAAYGRADVHWRDGARNPLLRNVLSKIKSASLAPVIEIVGWFDEECEAFSLEKKLINKFGRRDDGSGTLCNFLTDDGGGGWTHSETTKQKIKEARHRQLRKPCSDETKKKISEAQLGKLKGPNPEHSVRMKGRKLSAEHRLALSEARKGRVVSEETRKKIRKSNLGKKCSEETREKLRLSHLNKRPSDATLAKMSESQRKTWDGDEDRRARARDQMIGNNHALRGAGVHSRETRNKVSAAVREWWASGRSRSATSD